MNRGIHTSQADQCDRCGGRLQSPQRAARSERPCTCWDPLVEWLMDRTDKRRK